MLDKQVFSRRVLGALAATVLLAVHFSASATNITAVAYDAETDKLIVEISYRGTHQNHSFTIQWGECRPLDNDRFQIYGLLVDSDEDDRALQNFSTTLNVDVASMSCRPAKVTLRTATGFVRSIDIPAARSDP